MMNVFRSGEAVGIVPCKHRSHIQVTSKCVPHPIPKRPISHPPTPFLLFTALNMA
jgi:hypothetical protein